MPPLDTLPKQLSPQHQGGAMQPAAPDGHQPDGRLSEQDLGQVVAKLGNWTAAGGSQAAKRVSAQMTIMQALVANPPTTYIDLVYDGSDPEGLKNAGEPYLTINVVAHQWQLPPASIGAALPPHGGDAPLPPYGLPDEGLPPPQVRVAMSPLSVGMAQGPFAPASVMNAAAEPDDDIPPPPAGDPPSDEDLPRPPADAAPQAASPHARSVDHRPQPAAASHPAGPEQARHVRLATERAKLLSGLLIRGTDDEVFKALTDVFADKHEFGDQFALVFCKAVALNQSLNRLGKLITAHPRLGAEEREFALGALARMCFFGSELEEPGTNRGSALLNGVLASKVWTQDKSAMVNVLWHHLAEAMKRPEGASNELADLRTRLETRAAWMGKINGMKDKKVALKEFNKPVKNAAVSADLKAHAGDMEEGSVWCTADTPIAGLEKYRVNNKNPYLAQNRVHYFIPEQFLELADQRK
jgi:hypothetical protein